MTTWYRTGTIALTNGQIAATGTGTAWILNVAPGDALLAPDGKLYEIGGVSGDGSLTFVSGYLGSTASGQAYAVIPNQSFIRSLVTQAAALIGDYAAVKDGIGQGKFPSGTQSVPGMRFAADDNTGLRSTGPDAMALVAGGVDQAVVSSNGFTARIMRMWNTAGTFVGSFTSSLAAARTWTFPDKDGTVAMVSDFASPGPIGYTAPSTINATDLTAKGYVNFGSGQAATASASVQLGCNNTTQLALVSYGAAYSGGSAQGIGANGSLVDAITGNLALNAMAGKNVRLGVGYATVATVLPTGFSVDGHLMVGATNPMGSEKMLVKSSGASQGIMSANADTATTSSLLFLGWAAGTDRFIVYGNGNTVNTNNSYGALSDAKLKDIVGSSKSYWEKYKRVQWLYYTLKSDPANTKLLGVVAQELELIFPGLIEETPDYEDVEVEPARTEVRTVQRQKAEHREDVRYETVQVDGQWRKLPISTTVAVPVFEYHPLFDETGAALMEVAEPEQAEVVDGDGVVTTVFKAAVYRQSTHRVPVMEDVQETVDVPAKVERRLTGTVTKSVKYSVLGTIADVVTQEAQARIESLEVQVETILKRLDASEAA